MTTPLSARREIVLKNRFLEATFSDLTGNLLTLRAPWRRDPLVTALFMQYEAGESACSEDPLSEGTKEFGTVRVEASQIEVSSVIQSEHLSVHRRFALEPENPLLKVFFTFRGRGESAQLQNTRLPHVRLAGDFLSVVEGDERDLFFDGAEIGGGRQLPPWRVFFLPGHRQGLLVATRSKRMMSHMQIWPRLDWGVEFRPHLMCSYSPDYKMYNLPISVSPRKRYEAAFEIGPWQERTHRQLIRRAALDLPVRANPPLPPRRRPVVRLPGKLFRAVDIAPANAVSKGYHPAKWMITDETACRSSRALFANGGVRPPLLILDPKLKGLHRVYVGAGTAAIGVLKLSGEPEPRYRQTPGNIKYFNPFMHHLGTHARPHEIDFGVADLTGQTVVFGMPPTQMTPGMLDYIRFVRLTPAQEQAWRRQEDRQPIIPLSGFVDTYDIGYYYADAKNPSTAPYRANVWAHRQAGFQKMFWRIDGECSDFPTRTGTVRPVSCWAHGAYEPQAKAYSLMLQRHDLLKDALAAARDYGIELWGWMRFNSYFSGVQSEFFKSHPEMWDRSESGAPIHFRLCMAFPEAQRHKIDILVEAAAYGLPGISLGFLHHPPIFHYHSILVDGYKRRYGKEPPRNVANRDFFQHLNTSPESDTDHLRWYRYRASFITQFGRDLRAALRAKGLGHVKVSIRVRPQHCLFDGIDIDAWLDERLCDEVVAGSYAGDPELIKPTTEWKRRVQDCVPLLGGIECADPHLARREIRRLVRENYDGICTYESNDAVTQPQMIELYRTLTAVPCGSR